MRDAWQMDPGRPDFVITGLRLEDGSVRVIASRDMTETELSADMRWAEPVWTLDRLDPLYPGPPAVIYTLSGRLLRFIMIDGPDYPSVIKGLWEHWGKQDADGRVPLPGIPQLEKGKGK